MISLCSDQLAILTGYTYCSLVCMPPVELYSSLKLSLNSRRGTLFPNALMFQKPFVLHWNFCYVFVEYEYAYVNITHI